MATDTPTLPGAGYPAVWIDSRGDEHAAQITGVRDVGEGTVDLVVFAHSQITFKANVARTTTGRPHCWAAAGGVVPVQALEQRIVALEQRIAALEQRKEKSR